MEKINPVLTASKRIAVGTEYAQNIFDRFPSVESVYVFGSTVRGDHLPESDLDMHYVVSKSAEPLPLTKAVHNGVFIDIEAVNREDVSAESVLSDAYQLGGVMDCVILFDRTGIMTRLKKAVSENDTPELADARLRKLAHPVLRNLA